MADALTIRSIETTPVRVPLARTYRGSTYHMTHRSTLLTRVVTEEGVVGTAYAGDEDADLLAIDRIVLDEIAPRLQGEDAFAVERCWELARPATFDILRNRRLGLVATACVDAAIWDAVGRALGQPLWRLWGGYRRRLPMIAIAGYHDSPQSVAEEVAELLDMGLAGLKLKVGSPAGVEHDAARVREARAAGGPGLVLAVDANQKWTREEALRFARLVEDEGLVWLEEPCRWDNDRRLLRDVRAGARVPVCAGQTELSAAGCLELMTGGSVDVCNFDSSWSGGPTEWRRVAAAAQPLGVAMAHHEEPQVAAHLLASIPHGTYVECFHPDRDPIWWNLVANRPALADGEIELPDEPGLGWELDLEYLEAHALA
jgi:L-alanine-DL-glutamate epimerase-like enolase superfamily enzyme